MTTANYVLHSDALSELPSSLLSSPNHALHPSQCTWNDYQCRDQRDVAQLNQFYTSAEIDKRASGCFELFDQSFEYGLAKHFQEQGSHILLLPNKAAFPELYQHQQSALLNIKSAKNDYLRQQGIKAAQVRAVSHPSGTAFAGLSVLQTLVDQLLSKTKPAQPTATPLGKMCAGARNFSIAHSKQLSKTVGRAIKLPAFKKPAFVVVEQSNNQQSLVWQGNELGEAYDWVKTELSKQTLLMPYVQRSCFHNSEIELNDAVAPYCSERAIEYYTSQPSLSAMLMFGKQVTNIGWVQLA
ncbi:hypothetical protein [Salinibius halmophilus]|uniref:hypothetical protein n=1 Tax=Salinibius halmophilus TaxID=1853216 RepID=UPI000E663CDD|nr:hypothetical protein [Salinibius halmophilus]